MLRFLTLVMLASLQIEQTRSTKMRNDKKKPDFRGAEGPNATSSHWLVDGGPRMRGNYPKLNAFDSRQSDAVQNKTLRILSDESLITRKGKIFSLFTIVQFRHLSCNSGNQTGQCMTKTECVQCGGVAGVTCAQGLGVCCVVTISGCGSDISLNNTYITTGDLTQGTCRYKLIVPDNVCQVRLDLDTFLLSPPTGNAVVNQGGVCSSDQFSVVRSGYPAPLTLCGNNTGQHLYFDVTAGDTPELQFLIDQTMAFERSYNVKMTFVECEQSQDGCNQYFTGETGTITSFNYYNSDPTRQLHLAGLDYTICIRREAGHCCLRLTPTRAPDGFDINGVLCASDCNTAQTCRTDGKDYFLIPEASEDGRNPVSYTRFCGAILNVFSVVTAEHPIVTCSNPYYLHFHSDATGNSGNTVGFNLLYEQLPCRTF